jgi:hypothetical protein
VLGTVQGCEHGGIPRTSQGVIFQPMESASADRHCPCISHLPRPQQLGDDTVGAEAAEIRHFRLEGSLRMRLETIHHKQCDGQRSGVK